VFKVYVFNLIFKYYFSFISINEQFFHSFC